MLRIQPIRYGVNINSSDPFIGNVVSLLHFNGSDGSTSFTDETGLTWGASGNAQIDTSKSVFGVASGLFDGSGDYITADDPSLVIGTGDFTIEAWVYRNVSATHNIISWSGNNAIYMNSGINSVFVQTGGVNRIISAGKTGDWFHIALCRSSGVLTFYIDGVKDAETPTISTNFTGSNVEIGRRVSSTNTWNGWVDEFRFTNGIARYSASFTPSATEFPNP